jgi:hypothetical protein
MRKLLVITALILFAGVAFGQTLNKGGVIGIHEWTLKLNPDVTMNQFLDFWKEKCIPKMKEVVPEMTPIVLKGIGENNKYEYAGLYYYNSIEDLRKYWSEDGTPTEKGAIVLEKYGPIMAEFPKFGDFTYTAKDWIIIE